MEAVRGVLCFQGLSLWPFAQSICCRDLNKAANFLKCCDLRHGLNHALCCRAACCLLLLREWALILPACLVVTVLCGYWAYER
jgi:hypothetical protein